MAKLTRRFYKGHDNYIRHHFVADVIHDDGAVERELPVFFARADSVQITLREVNPPDGGVPAEITFNTTTPPELNTFYRDDLGNLGVRYGDLTATVLGRTYHARIVVYDPDNPDGLVICSYGDDATTDTWELVCS